MLFWGMSKKSWPILYDILLYKIGLDSESFYIYNLICKMEMVAKKGTKEKKIQSKHKLIWKRIYKGSQYSFSLFIPEEINKKKYEKREIKQKHVLSQCPRGFTFTYKHFVNGQ